MLPPKLQLSVGPTLFNFFFLSFFSFSSLLLFSLSVSPPVSRRAASSLPSPPSRAHRLYPPPTDRARRLPPSAHGRPPPDRRARSQRRLWGGHKRGLAAVVSGVGGRGRGRLRLGPRQGAGSSRLQLPPRQDPPPPPPPSRPAGALPLATSSAIPYLCV